MSSYSGRRAPNFAQYLEDLNTIPSPYDLQQQQNESFNIDAELALFTNTEFLDFGHFGDMSMPLTYDPAEDETLQEKKSGVSDKANDVNYMDLLTDLSTINEYPTDFGSASASNIMPMTTSLPSLPSVHDSVFDSKASETATVITPQTPPKSSTSSTIAPVSSQVTGAKRKPSADAKNPDEAARVAAEEDKRRRNTAASARFRIKKKQREQALELSVKEATQKSAALEARVSQLELENQWLKNLITEKNGGESLDHKSESDIAQMFKKFLASQKTDGERRSTDSKIGVGTA